MGPKEGKDSASHEHNKRRLRRRLIEKSNPTEWKNKYAHRNVVKSVFHPFKRMVRDFIFSRSFFIASKLILCKALAYNLYI